MKIMIHHPQSSKKLSLGMFLLVAVASMSSVSVVNAAAMVDPIVLCDMESFPDEVPICATREMYTPSPACFGENCTEITYIGPYQMIFNFVEGIENGTDFFVATEEPGDDLNHAFRGELNFTTSVTWYDGNKTCAANVNGKYCDSCSVCDEMEETFTTDCTNLDKGIKQKCMGLMPVFYPFKKIVFSHDSALIAYCIPAVQEACPCVGKKGDNDCFDEFVVDMCLDATDDENDQKKQLKEIKLAYKTFVSETCKGEEDGATQLDMTEVPTAAPVAVKKNRKAAVPTAAEVTEAAVPTAAEVTTAAVPAATAPEEAAAVPTAAKANKKDEKAAVPTAAVDAVVAEPTAAAGPGKKDEKAAVPTSAVDTVVAEPTAAAGPGKKDEKAVVPTAAADAVVAEPTAAKGAVATKTKAPTVAKNDGKAAEKTTPPTAAPAAAASAKGAKVGKEQEEAAPTQAPGATTAGKMNKRY